MISAWAAAIGLLLTAVVSYWGVLTAQDQLQQSAEDAQKDMRAQASMVAMWEVPSKDGGMAVIANRSADPIYDVWVKANVTRAVIDSDYPEFGKYLMEVGTIAPCRRIELTLDLLEKSRVDDFKLPREAFLQVHIDSIAFTDSSGRRSWTRTPQGLREARNDDYGMPPQERKGLFHGGEFGAFAGEPKQAEGCGF